MQAYRKLTVSMRSTVGIESAGFQDNARSASILPQVATLQILSVARHPMTVTFKNTIADLVVPPRIRRRAGIKPGA